MIYVCLILSPYSLFCVGSYASYELSFPTTWRFCCLVCGLISQVLLESREKHDFAHWYPHQSTSTRTTFFSMFMYHSCWMKSLYWFVFFGILKIDKARLLMTWKSTTTLRLCAAYILELSVVLGGWFSRFRILCGKANDKPSPNSP